MSASDILIGETMGTAVLTLLGGGICAAVTLKKSKAQHAGWLAVTFGWGFAVLTAAYMTGSLSGAHLNPAVTLGLAIEGGTAWGDVPLYFLGQIVGAVLGSVLMWVAYYGQFRAHMADLPEPADRSRPGPVLGIFATGPEIRHAAQNLATEIIATVVLVLAILTQGLNGDGDGLGALGALITALVVVGIGLSLGGPTGYAINPVRDLGPRIAHQILPIPRKGGSDWSYAWIPVAGPLIGGALAGGIYLLAFA